MATDPGTHDHLPTAQLQNAAEEDQAKKSLKPKTTACHPEEEKQPCKGMCAACRNQNKSSKDAHETDR